MIELIKKYKEIIFYLFFGVCTTIINFFVFWIFSKYFNPEISNVFAWIISVIFAFVTNKLWVFRTTGFVFKELLEFTASRILSFAIDEGLLILLISYFFLNALISKIITNIFVVLLNYLLSKFIIFKKVDKWIIMLKLK